VVNASLNWASIVGIVLAVGGALLYFMRSFKPALARDYDVFFAAVGLLCGGILFFQGWRLDPILQFGQFLLAGTTVFFAYESVRLRGVTTEQARRSSYFDDDEPLPSPAGPYRPRMGGSSWDESEVERFDEPRPLRRRIPARDDEPETEDFYRPRRASRAAIPERAASRRGSADDWDTETSGAGPGTPVGRRYSAGPAATGAEFGTRRRDRDSQPEPRRGSRPPASNEVMPRSSRRPAGPTGASASSAGEPVGRPGIPQGSPIRASRGESTTAVSDADFSPISPRGNRPSGNERPGRERSAQEPGAAPRDNASRFDD
jgi:hypothetical protein